MEKKYPPLDIKYRIVKILSVKFNFEDLREETIEKLFATKDALDLNITTDFKIEKEPSTITIDISTNLLNKQDESAIIVHTGRTMFHLVGLDKAYKKETDSFVLPDNLTAQLYSLAYSHSRALLAAELNPTLYRDKYFLPVLDASIFLNDKEKRKASKK